MAATATATVISLAGTGKFTPFEWYGVPHAQDRSLDGMVTRGTKYVIRWLHFSSRLARKKGSRPLVSGNDLVLDMVIWGGIGMGWRLVGYESYHVNYVIPPKANANHATKRNHKE